MKIGFLITARLKSTRLKFKLLKQLNGFSVVERVIQRAKEVRDCEDIILCTSRINQDLPLVKTAINNNIYYYNGSSEDVLQRMLDAAELFEMDYVIGITADNPLFSIHHANVISETIKAETNLDFIFTSGLPIGLNIYGIKTKALKTVCSIKEEIDTEIWGYLVNRPEIFNVKEIKVNDVYRRNDYRMTLDEIDDYLFFRSIYKNFPKNSVLKILDVYKYLDANPSIASLNKMVVQKDLDSVVKVRISKFYKKNKQRIIELKRQIYAGD
jgi:spore coat polysaccharide biosynthesis protein SpsF